MNTRNKLLIGIALIVLAVASRTISTIPNASAVGAVALFSGYFLGWKRGMIIPISAMLISDLLIEGVYDVWVMIAVYVGLAFPALLGHGRIQVLKVKNQKASVWLNILGKSLMGSTFFFLISNFAVWLSSGMYAPDWNGLLNCYYMALPFFRFTWIGDMVFNTAIFGCFFLAIPTVKTSKLMM